MEAARPRLIDNGMAEHEGQQQHSQIDGDHIQLNANHYVSGQIKDQRGAAKHSISDQEVSGNTISREDLVDTTFTKVFVGGLAWQTDNDSMRRHFEQFGKVLEAVVITDKATGRSKGYGFVTFREADAASRACIYATPVIDGRRTNCNLASLRSRANNVSNGQATTVTQSIFGDGGNRTGYVNMGAGGTFSARVGAMMLTMQEPSLALLSSAGPHPLQGPYHAYQQPGFQTYQIYGYPFSQEQLAYQQPLYDVFGGAHLYPQYLYLGSRASLGTGSLGPNNALNFSSNIQIYPYSSTNQMQYCHQGLLSSQAHPTSFVMQPPHVMQHAFSPPDVDGIPIASSGLFLSYNQAPSTLTTTLDPHQGRKPTDQAQAMEL